MDSSSKMVLVLKQTESFKKRWLTFVDSGLRLLLSDSACKKMWRNLYGYKRWRLVGTTIGSLIMTALMQVQVKAQIGERAEDEIESVFSPYLTGVSDFNAVLFGSGRLLVYVFGFGLIVFGIYDGITNRGSNWHIWAGIGSTLIIGVVLMGILEQAVFG